ncbi:MAG: DUF2070 family protein [Thermofilum sp.]
MSDKFGELKRAYKLVFALPRSEVLAAMILALTLLCFLAASAVDATRSFIGAAASAALTVLVGRVVDGAIITWRRAGGFYAVFLLSSLFFLLLSGSAYPGALLAALLGFLFLSATSGPLKAALPLFSFLAALSVLAGRVAAIFSIIALGYVLVVLGGLALIDYRVKKTTGVSGMALLRGFLRYILSGEKRSLEEALAGLSSERVLNLHLFDFENSEGDLIGRIIVSEIHPGPFRDLGSSGLPREVIAAHGSLPVLYLKAPSSHAENLAFSDEVSRLVRELMQTGRAEAHYNYARIGVAARGRFRVVVLSFDHVSLAFIDPLVPMEDLPHYLSRLLSLQGVVAVDTHSMISKDYSVLEKPTTNLQEYYEVFSALAEALEKPRGEGSLRAAFKRVDYSDGISVAPGGVSCAVLSVGSLRVGIVSIDSNNVQADFKPVLLKSLERHVSVPIVASTDTHLLTGRRTGVEYYPAGSTSPDRLLSTCLECIEEAAEKLEEAKVGYTVFPFKSLYTSGDLLEEISRVSRGNVLIGIGLITLAVAASALALL